MPRRVTTPRIDRIVSGGQTGADRAALDVAVELAIDCGGWVPRGRLAEDGVIPDRYAGLVEADDERPAVRTALNVRDSDATLILSHGELTGADFVTFRVRILPAEGTPVPVTRAAACPTIS